MKNYVKQGQKLPLFGVGPYIIFGMGIVAAIGVILCVYILKIGNLDGSWIPVFRIIGALLIVLGLTVWFIGAVRSDMDASIAENRLKTDGIYAWVRNPMYSGWWLIFAGITLMWHNAWTLLTIPVNWASLKEYDAMQSGWRKWVNEHMEIGGFKAWGMDFAGKDILEVGCGSGYSASLIIKDHPKSYTGMDIMPEQLEKAEALALPGARFLQGDAADLSRFEDESFDMIVDFMILHHVEGWRRFLDEAFRVLRSGGEMYINDLTRKGVHLTDFLFHWDHAEEPLFTMKEFEQQARKSGFM